MRTVSIAIFALLLFASNLALAQSSLKKAYEGRFLIGATLNPSHFARESASHTDLIASEFNSISPENAMKWQSLHPAPGRFRFDAADRFVEFGERHKMFIVGHTLVWHSQTPEWVFEDDDGDPVGREALIERMRDHIHTVVGRYKGRVNGWDVVNEALNDDGTLRDSPWRRIIGDDYLLKAFQFAHEADPEAELYYNDFGIENQTKRKGAIELLKELQAAGVPLTGVGIQEHVNLVWPAVELVDAAIADYAALGLKVMITELDVDLLPHPKKADERTTELHAEDGYDPALDPYRDGLPAEIQRQLAERYARLFGVYLKHADVVERVTFWGVTDEGSWLNRFPIRGRVSHPLLFDRLGEPKPAYHAVIEAAERRTTHSEAKPEGGESEYRPIADRPVPRADRSSRIAHAQLLEKTRQGRVDVYFEGDSIMRRWGATDYPRYLADWNETFHGWNAANFAWGGDCTQHMLWRLENGELDGVRPKVVVLQAGTNNIGFADRSADPEALSADVTRGIEALLEVFREKTPEATIILTAIFPRNDKPDAMPVIDRINRNIARFADGKKIRFLNINDRLADANGGLREGMFLRDKLHLDLNAYRVWGAALKPMLTEILGPPADEDFAPSPTGDPSAAPPNPPQ